MNSGLNRPETRRCSAGGPCAIFAPSTASLPWSNTARPDDREDVRDRGSVGASDCQPVVAGRQRRYLGEGPVLADLINADSSCNHAGPEVEDCPTHRRASHIAANLEADGRLLFMKVTDTQPEPCEAGEELAGISRRAAQQPVHVGEHWVRVLQRGMPERRIHHVTLRLEQFSRYRRQ